MIDIFKFSNWNQLSGLKSYDYPNLEIHVSQFNSTQLIGTKIDIVDIDNNMIYFSGFIRVISSERFNSLAVYEVSDMIKRINSYGFNIEIMDPIILPPNVITMLRGLYFLGYNYITLEYLQTTDSIEKALNEPEHNLFIEPEDFSLCPRVYSNKYVVVSKYLGDLPSKKQQFLIPPSADIYIISKAPEFNWEDFKWLEPTRVYAIELLLEYNEDPDKSVSDAIVSESDLEEGQQ